MGETLELGEVVDHAAAEERGAVLEGRLVDYDRRAFGLDALHHALNRRLAEIVGIRLHRQTVDTNDTFLFRRRTKGVVSGVIVVTGHFKHLVCDEILARAVALDDGRHHVLRHICIVGEQLLGIFR